jgi:hypothetical protein
MQRGAAALIGSVLVAALLSSCSTGAAPATKEDAPKDPSAVVAKCMQDLGWKVTVGSDGAVLSPEVPTSQASAYEKASAECWARIKPASFSNLDEKTRKFFYSTLISVRGCIVKNGYDLPAAPTYQTWVGLSGKWSPYLDLGSTLSQAQMSKLLKACPLNLR